MQFLDPSHKQCSYLSLPLTGDSYLSLLNLLLISSLAFLELPVNTSCYRIVSFHLLEWLYPFLPKLFFLVLFGPKNDLLPIA